MGLIKMITGIKANKSDVYDFERDHQAAISKPQYQSEKPKDEATLIGSSENRQNVFIENDAKHVFVCGTTGSGKTIALSNLSKVGLIMIIPC